MEEKLIVKIRLENGLTLELFDCSRRTAGDRWLVSFFARIELDVRAEHFEAQGTTEVFFEDVRAALGGKATYSYETERNFVPETEKDEVFMELEKSFLETTLDYLSAPDFPRKLILMEYQKSPATEAEWKALLGKRDSALAKFYVFSNSKFEQILF